LLAVFGGVFRFPSRHSGAASRFVNQSSTVKEQILVCHSLESASRDSMVGQCTVGTSILNPLTLFSYTSQHVFMYYLLNDLTSCCTAKQEP
jgi:hypothetical protein